MEDIYVVETGELGGESFVENLWNQLTEAENYINARLFTETDDPFKRDKSQEDDTTLRFFANSVEYICIKVKTV
jgi:hypothetical protein